jgi:hypothetical protein
MHCSGDGGVKNLRGRKNLHLHPSLQQQKVTSGFRKMAIFTDLPFPSSYQMFL